MIIYKVYNVEYNFTEETQVKYYISKELASEDLNKRMEGKDPKYPDISYEMDEIKTED